MVTAFTDSHFLAVSVAAFVCRLILYCASCALAVTVKGFETETGQSLVISCLQILIVSGVILIYNFCALLLSELRIATGYEGLDAPELTVDNLESDISTHLDEHIAYDSSVTEHEMARRHTEPVMQKRGEMADVELRERPIPPGMQHLPEVQTRIDFLSRADSNDLTLSTDRPNPPPATVHLKDDSWVFPDAKALSAYVMRVHFIGFVLWSTVVGVDFSHPRLLLFFVCGLFAGVMLSQGKIHSTRRSLVICIFFFYSVLTTVLIVICFSSLEIDWTDSSVIFFLFVVASTGFVWGVQTPSPRILATAESAFITTSLMSVPIFFLLSTIRDVEYLVSEDVFGSLYILVLEPMLKFLNIYVLVISIKTNRAVELSVILVCVLCISVLMRQAQDQTGIQSLFDDTAASLAMPQPTVVVASICITLLVVVHLARIYID